MRNKSGHPSFDSFVPILFFSDGAYFAPQFSHAPSTTALLPVASPSHSELFFGIKTKTRASSV